MLKFASEETGDAAGIIGAGMLINIAFVVDLLHRRRCVTGTDGDRAALARACPVAPVSSRHAVASLIRNVALILLQTRFGIARIFWVDAVHFLGAPLLVWIYSRMHLFDTAEDLIMINILSLSASSLLGLVLTWPLFRWRLTPTGEEMHRMWEYGKYSLGGNASYLVYSRADTFILSAFTGPAQVAVYNSAKIFTRIFDMATQIIQMFMLPGASLLASRGERSTLKVVVEKSTMFATVGMIPVMAGMILFAGPMISIIYGGRYPEAVLILQIFALMSVAVPAFAIGSNRAHGTRRGTRKLCARSTAAGGIPGHYLITIPWLGAIGAAIGVVLASYIMGWIALARVQTFVPFTVREVLARHQDIRIFLVNRIFKTGRRQ